MRTYWDFHSPESIVFGSGSIARLDAVLKRLGARAVLLVTDPGLAASGIAARVERLLADNGYDATVYAEAVPEPPVAKAVECFAFARARGRIDAIVGLGGGSSIDLAKIVALLLAHGGHPRDYFGENAVPGPIAPLVAIPTTAGTGSEVTSVAVVTDTDNGVKVGISDNYLRPAVALLDPELTLGLPPYVTACSGIDALAHAIEAYTARDSRYIQADGDILFQGSTPLSDTLALEAIARIGRSLVTAVQQGSNLEARTDMLLGSLYAGMAFSNAGTAIAHALAYPIGGAVKSPHGEITGLLLPYAMRYNAAVQPEKMRRVAHALGLPADGDAGGAGRSGGGMSGGIGQSSAAEYVLELLAAIGLPSKLADIGVKRESLPDIAEKGLAIGRLIRNNPRTPTREGLLGLLEEAY